MADQRGRGHPVGEAHRASSSKSTCTSIDAAIEACLAEAVSSRCLAAVDPWAEVHYDHLAGGA